MTEITRQNAFLWVTMEVGENAHLAEFHDWYDTEHVPLRMGSLVEFLTGIRYEAADGGAPGWSATYEVSDPQLFAQHKYTRLRANRSPREADLIGRLATVDRRTYTELVGDSSTVPPRGVQQAAPFSATIASNERPGTVDSLNSVKGWRRTHAYKLGDSLLTGHGKQPLNNLAPGFVTVHEFTTQDYLHDPAFRDATPTAAEVRHWKLYRAWDNTAK